MGASATVAQKAVVKYHQAHLQHAPRQLYNPTQLEGSGPGLYEVSQSTVGIRRNVEGALDRPSLQSRDASMRLVIGAQPPAQHPAALADRRDVLLSASSSKSVASSAGGSKSPTRVSRSSLQGSKSPTRVSMTSLQGSKSPTRASRSSLHGSASLPSLRSDSKDTNQRGGSKESSRRGGSKISATSHRTSASQSEIHPTFLFGGGVHDHLEPGGPAWPSATLPRMSAQVLDSTRPLSSDAMAILSASSLLRLGVGAATDPHSPVDIGVRRHTHHAGRAADADQRDGFPLQRNRLAGVRLEELVDPMGSLTVGARVIGEGKSGKEMGVGTVVGPASTPGMVNVKMDASGLEFALMIKKLVKLEDEKAERAAVRSMKRVTDRRHTTK